MFKRILVPYAGSSTGDKSLRYVEKIARDNGSKVTILHVMENIPTPLALATQLRKDITKNLAEVQNDMKKDMIEKLDKKAKTFRDQNIPTTIVVLHGYPEEEITRISNSEDYDLIVMAKRTRFQGMAAIFKLGSVSRKVMEKVSCPLLLIDGDSE